MRRMNKSSISVLLFLCLIAAAVSGGCAGKSEEYPGGQGADGRKSGITAPAGSEVITALSQQEKKGTEAENRACMGILPGAF